MRSPQPFEERFARTASESTLREHFAANGPTAFESDEPESPFAPLSAKKLSIAKQTSGKRLSVVDLAHLNSLNVAQLRQLCAENDLPRDGKKEELVTRLGKAGVRDDAARTPRSTPRRSVRGDRENAEVNEETVSKPPTGIKAPQIVRKPSSNENATDAKNKAAAPSKIKNVGVRRSATVGAPKEANAAISAN